MGGAALALCEGELAGHAVVRDAGRADTLAPRRRARLERRRAGLTAFARALADACPVPPAWDSWLTDETVICRCEEVRAAAVRASLAAGAGEHRQVKQLTRAGMGRCQGRMCGPAVHLLAQGAAGEAADGGYVQTERQIITPVLLKNLAATGQSLDPRP